jgi:CheY-like chemotaxis protein
MNKRRILVIDDNVNSARIVKLALERTGPYEVLPVNDPAQSLAVTREFKPDLILLDVCMPGLEGSEVAEEIASDPDFAETPIVFLTSIVTPQEAGKTGTLMVGSHEYIAKPIRPEVISACIERHLTWSDRRRHRPEHALPT